MPEVTVGSRVAYSVQFLRSIGAEHTPLAHARGLVEELRHQGGGCVLAKVYWGDSDVPERVNVANLAVVGPNPKFCRC